MIYSWWLYCSVRVFAFNPSGVSIIVFIIELKILIWIKENFKWKIITKNCCVESSQEFKLFYGRKRDILYLYLIVYLCSKALLRFLQCIVGIMKAKMELLKDIKRHSYAPEDPEYRRLLTRLRNGSNIVILSNTI